MKKKNISKILKYFQIFYRYIPQAHTLKKGWWFNVTLWHSSYQKSPYYLISRNMVHTFIWRRWQKSEVELLLHPFSASNNKNKCGFISLVSIFLSTICYVLCWQKIVANACALLAHPCETFLKKLLALRQNMREYSIIKLSFMEFEREKNNNNNSNA